MRVGGGYGILVASCLIGTSAFAQTAVMPAQPVAAPANVSVSGKSLPTTVRLNEAQPGERGDGLRADARWPQFESCVTNTKSPTEFDACLRTAFLNDSTGQVASLMGR